jgi:GAF domain-containing protein
VTTRDWEAAVRDPERIAALESSGLVGTGPEDSFDRLIELAVEVIGAPRGCIALVDTERTTAKSAVGFPEGVQLSAPVELSFCRFVVGSGRPLVVENAHTDPRTAGDPAIDAFDAVAWAGYPISDADGAILGTFCLMDSEPHQWRPTDLHLLATLAQAASSEISLRASTAQVEAARREAVASRAAAERQRTLLIAHVDELVGLGEPAAGVGWALLAQLGALQLRPLP